MKLQNIINKWDYESKDLASRMEFLAEHNFNHERDFLGRDPSDSMVCRAYCKGAEVQKAIDDKEKEELINLASKRIADVEASRSRLLQRREYIQEHIEYKKFIRDLIKWIENNKQPILASDTDDTVVGYSVVVDNLVETIKAMEEV